MVRAEIWVCKHMRFYTIYLQSESTLTNVCPVSIYVVSHMALNPSDVGMNMLMIFILLWEHLHSFPLTDISNGQSLLTYTYIQFCKIQGHIIIWIK